MSVREKKAIRNSIIMILTLTLIAAIAFVGGCGKSSDDPDPKVVATELNGVVVKQTPFTGNLHGCEHGGISVEVGIDKDANGTLDAGEIDSAKTQYVCNGAPGAKGDAGVKGDPGTDGTAVNGSSAVVKITAETSWANCTTGGNKISAGIDANNNGTLDSGEETSSTLICNGDVRALAKRHVFLDSILPNKNYKWFHNSTDPTGTKMLVAVNQADAPQGVSNGKIDLYLLDALELEKGVVKQLVSRATLSATSVKANAFRSSWSADGSKIFMAAGDTFFVVNGSTLAQINELSGLGGDNHDALATADGNYAVLTLRNKPFTGDDANKVDGVLRLYSTATNTMVGAAVNVCLACHGEAKASTGSILCGITGSFTEASGVYTGRVYVAGHGGHIATADLTITPANTATPIVVSNLNKLQVQPSGRKHGSNGESEYKLHDVRLDGTTLYWSTYNTDKDGKLHYGKMTAAAGGSAGLVDFTVDVPERATKPGPGTNKMPMYCGSGQTANAYMPSTMSNEAYITVIPKAEIQ